VIGVVVVVTGIVVGTCVVVVTGAVVVVTVSTVVVVVVVVVVLAAASGAVTSVATPITVAKIVWWRLSVLAHFTTIAPVASLEPVTPQASVPSPWPNRRAPPVVKRSSSEH
jgi:hypothetical protein